MKLEEELVELNRLQAKELITIKRGIIALVIFNIGIFLNTLGYIVF